MTKKQLIECIASRLKEIRDLYYEEYPEGSYLTLFIHDGKISFNNEYWSEDKNNPIDYFEDKTCL